MDISTCQALLGVGPYGRLCIGSEAYQGGDPRDHIALKITPKPIRACMDEKAEAEAELEAKICQSFPSEMKDVARKIIETDYKGRLEALWDFWEAKHTD